VRVLSIDGGGVRGLLPATIVAEIEERAGKPAHELFDLMVGTSVGGITAMALAVPDGADARSPRRSGKDLVDFYAETAPRIFSLSVRERVRTGDSLVRHKYPSGVLDEVLEEAFGETRLAAALAPVMVTAFDTENRRPIMFKSEEAKREPEWDLPMRIVGRAAIAAPTFFEPLHLELADGEWRTCVDGGIYVNNPAMCAYVEALTMDPDEDTFIVSIGTGEPDRHLPFEEVREWGLVHWAQPLLDFTASGVNQSVTHQLEQLLEPNSYYRLQAVIGRKHLPIDDVGDANMRTMRDAAAKLIAERDLDLDAICERLLEP
jgi:patatin-like phospholipase/acyl hydrolase